MVKWRDVAVFLLVCSMLAVAPAAQAVSCLVFPLSCLKKKVKFGDDFEATVLDIRSKRTEHYEMGSDGIVSMGWSSLQNQRTWYVWYRYGHTIYQAERVDTIAQMAFGYKPTRSEWIGKTIKMRLADEKWLGIKGTSVRMTRPDGKEWVLALVSIIGPNGKDECARSLGMQYCPPQTKIDRDAVEQAQLAELQQTGQKSAADVEPMPVDVPDSPMPDAAPAATDGSAAAPAPSVAEPAPAGGQAGTESQAPQQPAPPAQPGPPPSQ